jgi:putative ABC transport system substrate-binding protein
MRLLHSILALMTLGLTVDLPSASAQEPVGPRKIGFLEIGSWGQVSPPLEHWVGPGAAFRDRLQAAGYVAGQDFVVVRRNANGEVDWLGPEARALVASGVDVIVTGGSMATMAAMKATQIIPIVFFGVSLPVEKGIVASLKRPGRNVTGVAVIDAVAKQWQLLHQVAPEIRRAGRLENAANRPADEHYATYRAQMFETVKADASAVGIEPIRMGAFELMDIEPAFIELARRGEAGVVIMNDPLMVSLDMRPTILDIATRLRLPTSCARDRAWAQSGCLVTYAEDWEATLRAVAGQVAKVLHGTKPGDVSVEQSLSHKVIINAKTAKALGLTVPPALLAAADEVIE